LPRDWTRGKAGAAPLRRAWLKALTARIRGHWAIMRSTHRVDRILGRLFSSCFRDRAAADRAARMDRIVILKSGPAGAKCSSVGSRIDRCVGRLLYESLEIPLDGGLSIGVVYGTRPAQVSRAV
jgi:hypothetical protein